MTDQTTVFEGGEGDAWFRRNSEMLAPDRADHATEMSVRLIRERAGAIRSVCEVGCANGWRLSALASQLQPEARICGFDVSADAIADGKMRWPDLDLFVGAADCPPVEGPFDLVIVSFVLHWVDRARLARTVAALDELVDDDRYLIVADFLPDAPCRTAYHHLPEGTAYTYKQDYRAPFLGLGFYRELSAEIFAHGKDANGGAIPEQDRGVCALLAKSFSAYRLTDRA